MTKLEQIRCRVRAQEARHLAAHEYYKQKYQSQADDDKEDKHLYIPIATTYVYSLLHMPTNQGYFGITTRPEIRYNQHLEWTKCHIDQQITHANKHEWLYRELIDYNEVTQAEVWAKENTFQAGTKFVRYQAGFYEDELIKKHNCTTTYHGHNKR